ncbi:hypothetical protein KXS11_03735 [Plantibacter flavus]
MLSGRVAVLETWAERNLSLTRVRLTRVRLTRVWLTRVWLTRVWLTRPTRLHLPLVRLPRLDLTGLAGSTRLLRLSGPELLWRAERRRRTERRLGVRLLDRLLLPWLLLPEGLLHGRPGVLLPGLVRSARGSRGVRRRRRPLLLLWRLAPRRPVTRVLAALLPVVRRLLAVLLRLSGLRRRTARLRAPRTEHEFRGVRIGETGRHLLGSERPADGRLAWLRRRLIVGHFLNSSIFSQNAA